MSAALAKIIDRSWSFVPKPGPTPRPPSVRIARQDEEDKIFASLMMLAEENALAPVNEARVRALIERCRGPEKRRPDDPEPPKLRDGVIGIIDAPDGRIAASIGIIMMQWWYTNAWHCEEAWTYVDPLHRSGKFNYPKTLIAFAKWWSEQMGMPLIMGVLSTHRTLGKLRLYAREIPLVGAGFMWRGGIEGHV